MHTARSSHAAALVALLLYAAFIVYQTLAGGGAWECAAPVLAIPRRVPRSDALANVVAYVPLGLLLTWVTTRGWSSAASPVSLWRVVRSAIAGVGAAAVMSASLEIVQACQSHRVSSMYDLLANVVGGAIGVVAALVLRTAASGTGTRFGRRFAAPEDRLRLVTMLVVVVWVASQTMPWVFAVDVGTMRSNLSFLRRGFDGSAVDGWRVLRHAGAWLAVAAACRLAAGTAVRSIGLLAVSAAVSLMLQVLLDARAPLSIEELAGMAAVAVSIVPALIGAGVMPSHRRWGAVLLAGAMMAVTAYELRPEPGAAMHAFSWWPRVGLGGLLGAIDYALLFGWLGLTAVVAARWAASGGDRLAQRWWPVAVVVTTLALEVAQTRIPGRGPDVSAPVFTLLAVLLATTVLAEGERSER